LHLKSLRKSPARFAAAYCLLRCSAGRSTIWRNARGQAADHHGGAFALEAIGTFFLVNTVLPPRGARPRSRLAPFAIGMTVTACILMFGALTGGSVNPHARSGRQSRRPIRRIVIY